MASESKGMATQLLSWLSWPSTLVVAVAGSALIGIAVTHQVDVREQEGERDEPDGRQGHRRPRRPHGEWARLHAHAGASVKDDNKMIRDDKDSDEHFFELLDGTCVNAQQLGLMGLEALETVVEYWNLAINGCKEKVGREEINSNRLMPKLEHLMQRLIELQEEAEALFIYQAMMSLRRITSSSVLNTEVTCELEEQLVLATTDSDNFKSAVSRLRSLSSGSSFVSASSSLEDISSIREETENVTDNVANVKNELYEQALRQVDDMQYRSLRTHFVGLDDDQEYLAKLHCLRKAFELIVANRQWRDWWKEHGRDVFALLLTLFNRDSDPFISAYDELMLFLDDDSNRTVMLEELKARNVHSTNLYDVVFDYILIESFEDLESPPSSVVAVLRSGWLSDSFKQSALQTAIWSIVSAKRRLMKFESGFKSHFYKLSELVTPSLAWGFFGPDDELNRLMDYFKTQVLTFIRDMYSNKHVSFNSVEQLSQDIMNMAQKRVKVVLEHIEMFKVKNNQSKD